MQDAGIPRTPDLASCCLCTHLLPPSSFLPSYSCRAVGGKGLVPKVALLTVPSLLLPSGKLTTGLKAIGLHGYCLEPLKPQAKTAPFLFTS
jgi:hypothetical protein